MSFTEMNYWVHLHQECPTTSSSRDILHTLYILSGHGSSRTTPLADLFFGFVYSQREYHSSHMTNPRVDTTRSSVNNFAQIIEANFLCRDECVTTQSVTDFGHRFDVLITSFTSNAKSSAKFPFVETCCVSRVDICTCSVSA